MHEPGLKALIVTAARIRPLSGMGNNIAFAQFSSGGSTPSASQSALTNITIENWVAHNNTVGNCQLQQR
jgi:hypothetical protein